MSCFQLYLVGTVHNGYTPEGELRQVLADIDPIQVLLELPPLDIDEIKKSGDPRNVRCPSMGSRVRY